MKNLIIAILIIPFLSFSQVFIFDNTNLEWDLKQMSVSGDFDGLIFDGNLNKQSINIKGSIRDYYVIENNNGAFAMTYLLPPSTIREKSYISKVYVSNSTLKDLTKAIRKNKFSKVSMKFSGDRVAIFNKEILLKKQMEREEKELKIKAANEQLQKNINEYGGVYKVKIYKSSGITFDNQFGKLYITEQGMTLKTEIPTMERISGSFSIPITNKIEEGMFAGNLGKGTLIYDNFILSINEDSTVAGLTLATNNYRTMDTTTLIIVEKISELQEN